MLLERTLQGVAKQKRQEISIFFLPQCKPPDISGSQNKLPSLDVDFLGLQSQFPQFPCPPICVPELSTFVEHHFSVSPGSLPSVVHLVYVLPANLNGNMQFLFGSGPLFVVHPKEND